MGGKARKHLPQRSRMSEPVVSVLMTVFNAGRFFDPSIRSILNQTFRNFEFLIVDDASTDGSAEVAEAWAGKDPRIRVIRNADNKGQTTCLNQGLQLARGRWIARQDADDLAHPSRLAKQHQFTTIRPEIVLLGSNGRIIDEHDRLAGLLDAPLSQQAITWTSPFLNPFMHTSVMFRTDVIRDQFGGYNEAYRIAQDYELWTRVIAAHTKGQIFPSGSSATGTSQHRCQSPDATWPLPKPHRFPHERPGASLGAA